MAEAKNVSGFPIFIDGKKIDGVIEPPGISFWKVKQKYEFRSRYPMFRSFRKLELCRK